MFLLPIIDKHIPLLFSCHILKFPAGKMYNRSVTFHSSLYGFIFSLSSQYCLKYPAIPTWFLFQHGRIVWRGHPSSIDLEATIPSLQEGNGVVPAPENDGALGPTPGLSDLQDFSDDQLLEFCQSLQVWFL